MTALPTGIVAGNSGHISHHNTIHALLNPVDAPFSLAGIAVDTLANLPAAGVAGREFVDITFKRLLVDDGVAWRPTSAWVVNAMDPIFGATGDGVTDDTVALTAWLAEVKASGSGDLPDGVYKTDGTLTVDSLVDAKITFGGNAWLAPTTGFALKLTDPNKVDIHGFKVRVNSGSTMTRGLWCTSTGGSGRINLYSPVGWAFANIPAGVTLFDIDVGIHWVNVYSPHVRKDSGAITGTFAKAFRFGSAGGAQGCNAHNIYGGDIAHADRGVECDGVNDMNINNVAYEGVPSAVYLTEPAGAYKNQAIRINGYRVDSGVTYIIDIAQTSTAVNPMQVFGGVDGGAAYIRNPNHVPINFVTAGGIVVSRGPDAAGITELLTTSAGSTRVYDESGSARIGANGDVILDIGKSGLTNRALSVKSNGTEVLRLDAGTGFLTIYNAFALASIQAAGELYLQDVSTKKLGFFKTAGATTKQTVTGSRGGNAALASLLTALAGYGLIVDSSTA